MTVTSKRLVRRFSAPVAVLLWALVAVPLWLLAGGIADAQQKGGGSKDPSTSASTSTAPFATSGTQCGAVSSSNWQVKDRLKLVDSASPCWTLYGTLIYGEGYWDDDYDWYINVDSPGGFPGWSGAYATALQTYSECHNQCNFITETDPRDQSAEPAPCLDVNHTTKVNPSLGKCWGKNYRVKLTGALVMDTNHKPGNWYEFHPMTQEIICQPTDTSCSGTPLYGPKTAPSTDRYST